MKRGISAIRGGLGVFGVLAAMAAVLGAGGASALPAYTILDLGTLGGNSSSASHINNLGQVVGSSTASDGSGHAFRTAPNQPINPATDDVIASSFPVIAINDVGQLFVGSLFTAYRTQPNAPLNPATDNLQIRSGNSTATISNPGINNLGQVTGWFYDGGGDMTDNAFFIDINRTFNRATDFLFPLFGGEDEHAAAINNRDQIVGGADTLPAPNNGRKAYRADPNGAGGFAYTDLGSLGGGNQGLISDAFDINDLGQAVGEALAPGGSRHAFRTGPNLAINPATDDLGTLPGSSFAASSASAINNAGVVVGNANVTSTVTHAFVFDGQMLDLNNLLVNGAGWTLTTAADVNNLGQIVGTGTINGQTHAFVLTPVTTAAVPVPGAVWLGGAGLAGVFALRRRVARVLR